MGHAGFKGCRADSSQPGSDVVGLAGYRNGYRKGRVSTDGEHPPLVVSATEEVLSAHSAFVEAVVAVHRPLFSGLKWYFGLTATLRTYGGEHLTGSPEVVARAAL